MQNMLTSGPLLDADGNLTERGYALSPVKEYRRADIKAGRLRVKEWDYYMAGCDEFALALTVSDHGYLGFHSVALMDFSVPFAETRSALVPLPLGRVGLGESPGDRDVKVERRGFFIEYRAAAGSVFLSARVANFRPGADLSAEIELYDFPAESMVIATPFSRRGCFYYNMKTNCIRARGGVRLGERVYDLRGGYAVCDWGRGVWTYKNVWYWATASGEYGGKRLGWNLGYGFGDTSAATENMIFYDGRAHKLTGIDFGIPQKDGRPDYLSPWHFTSSDGRFDMRFDPVVVRRDKLGVGLIASDQHQTFGRFTGNLILDDGTKLSVRDFSGSCEVFYNRA